MNIEQVARICHDANRSYCLTLNDTSQPTWDYAPQWQRDSAIAGVNFHLQFLKSGERPDPSASHESWLEQKEQDGWKYGPVKDADKKEHPCCVPYTQLPFEQRVKDYIFCAIVEAFWNAEKER